MNKKQLFTLSGLCLIGGGAARALFWLLVIPFATFSGVATTLSGLQRTAQILNVLGAVLLIFGFIGLYAAYYPQIKRLGLAGFALVLLGGMGVLVDAVIGLIIIPAMATAAPPTVEANGAFFVGSILYLYIVIFATNMIGQLLLSLSLWRDTSLPRAALGFFVVSAVLVNLPPFPILHYVLVAGGVAGGAGLIWLGHALREQSNG